MNDNKHTSNIEQRLEELRDVPARNPLRATSGRTRFLNEAAEYKQAVSPGKEMRQSRWIFQIRKEKLAMNVLVSLLLAASLILGGGATVAAAQDDLPNQSLYQLKLWTENTTMAMTGDPQDQANLLMTMAQRRVEEMAALADQGITPPDQVRERLQQHLDQALQIAADMDEATRESTLLQLRDCLQTQDRTMEQLQVYAGAETEPLLTQTRQMLQIRLQLVDEGLADPQGFQYIMENQKQYGQDEEAVPEPNQQGGPNLLQNDESGAGNEEPGGPNPNAPKDGNDGKSNNYGGPGGNQSDNGGNNSSGGQSDNGGNGSGGGGGGNK
jgi:uncharacterized membrane protein YgcG